MLVLKPLMSNVNQGLILFLSIFLSVSPASSKDSFFNTYYGNLLTNQAMCAGRGGDWAGMSCDNVPSVRRERPDPTWWRDFIEAFEDGVREYHQCLLVVYSERTPRAVKKYVTGYLKYRKREEQEFMIFWDGYDKNYKIAIGLTAFGIDGTPPLSHYKARRILPQSAECHNPKRINDRYKLASNAKIRANKDGDPAIVWTATEEFMSKLLK